MSNWPLPTSVVAHDAGAANLIIAWVKAWAWPCRAYLEGPALKLWKHAFPDNCLCQTMDEALDGCNSVITGTGWASKLEHDARRIGHGRNLRVAAVLDHWVNYAERFERNGETVWPDELWVADSWAADIAKQTLPEIFIRQFENLYLSSQITRVAKAPLNGSMLYLLEPVRSNWGLEQNGEFQALDYTLKNLNIFDPLHVQRIILRLHPSEVADKYDKYLKADKRIEIDAPHEIYQSISKADIVVGVESFGLTLALAAGRPVYSSLPPWAPELRLPHEGIKQIRRICSP